MQCILQPTVGPKKRLLQAPTATERDIKRAYYNSMRSCHPDLAASQEDEESATEVCVFLNDVYEARASLVVFCLL